MAGKTSPSTTIVSSAPLPAAPSARGRVQRIYPERGFGFIRCLESARPDDIGEDFFFHHSGLADCAIRDLEEGSLVRFAPTYVAKGKRAEHVERVR